MEAVSAQVEEPTVYIVHQAYVRDPDTKELVPKHDLAIARPFGKLELMLKGSHEVPFDAQELIPLFRRKLKDFSDIDYLLPTGDPIAMGVAIAIAAEINDGRVRILKWERRAGRYIEAELDFDSSQYID